MKLTISRVNQIRSMPALSPGKLAIVDIEFWHISMSENGLAKWLNFTDSRRLSRFKQPERMNLPFTRLSI